MPEPQPTVSTSDLGVVDPIRIPGVARAIRIWSGLPRPAQVFVALVGVDIAIRALGLFHTSLFLEVSAPLTWLTAFVPHDALILLPAVILARRPSAMAESPDLVRGAIAVAIVELSKDPLRGLLTGNGADGGLVSIVLIGLIASLATAAGWVAMARGMQGMTPPRPFDSTRLLANVIGGALALLALTAAVSALLGQGLELGDETSALLVRLAGAAAALGGLGLAYLAWVIARGTDDPARPAVATKLATASVAGVAIGSFLSLAAGTGLVWFLIVVATWVGGMTGLVVAFGLGLADPSGTIERTVPTDDPVSRQPTRA